MKLLLKIILGGFVLISTLLLCAGLGAFYYAHQEFHKTRIFDNAHIVHIERGMGVGSITDLLVTQGILDEFPDSTIFQYGARFTNQSSKLKAGEYEIPAQTSIKDMLDLFESGKVIQRQVTVREGLTSYEIAVLLTNAKDLGVTEVETPAEGILLPETYSFSKGETNHDIIERMKDAMTDVLFEACQIEAQITAIEDILDYPCGAAPLKTVRDVLTLASIVEKETAVPSERNRVAGVFVNRLRRGMPLQTDPTVIYAMTMGKHQNDGQGPIGRRLLRKDLQIDSPYNTYKYPGLPPGPIANPGKASIEAVLAPEEHDYIYFVADGSGGHAFARTLNEHNNNVAKWRKIRKSQ